MQECWCGSQPGGKLVGGNPEIPIKKSDITGTQQLLMGFHSDTSPNRRFASKSFQWSINFLSSSGVVGSQQLIGTHPGT